MRSLQNYIKESVFDIDSIKGLHLGENVGGDLVIKDINFTKMYLEGLHNIAIVDQKTVDNIASIVDEIGVKEVEVDCDVTLKIQNKEFDLKGLNFVGVHSTWRFDEFRAPSSYTVKNGSITTDRMLIYTYGYFNVLSFSNTQLKLDELYITGEFAPEFKNNCKVVISKLEIEMKKSFTEDLIKLYWVKFSDLLTHKFKINRNIVKFKTLRVSHDVTYFEYDYNGNLKGSRGIKK